MNINNKNSTPTRIKRNESTISVESSNQKYKSPVNNRQMLNKNINKRALPSKYKSLKEISPKIIKNEKIIIKDGNFIYDSPYLGSKNSFLDVSRDVSINRSNKKINSKSKINLSK